MLSKKIVFVAMQQKWERWIREGYPIKPYCGSVFFALTDSILNEFFTETETKNG